MSSPCIKVFEVFRLIKRELLPSFLRYCDMNDRGLGWAGLERAQYRVRDSVLFDGFELRATWSFSASAKNPRARIEQLVGVWDTEFEMRSASGAAIADEFAEWRVVHCYNGNNRQDSRSPLMDEIAAASFVREPASLALLRESLAKSGLPPISISPQDGSLLKNLLTMVQAKKGIEIGTLGGYSAAWICEAIGPGGALVTIEKDAKRSRLAAESLAQLGYADRVECRAGNALQVLKNIEAQGPWDFVFIDADKASYGQYVQWAMQNVKPGGLILADNAYLWGGMLTFPDTWVDDPGRRGAGSRLHGFDAAEYQGMSDAWGLLAESQEFDSWMLPVPDGILVARKRSDQEI